MIKTWQERDKLREAVQIALDAMRKGHMGRNHQAFVYAMNGLSEVLK